MRLLEEANPAYRVVSEPLTRWLNVPSSEDVSCVVRPHTHTHTHTKHHCGHGYTNIPHVGTLLFLFLNVSGSVIILRLELSVSPSVCKGDRKPFDLNKKSFAVSTAEVGH